MTGMTAPACGCVPWLRMMVFQRQVWWECDRCEGTGEKLPTSDYEAASIDAQKHQQACAPSDGEFVRTMNELREQYRPALDALANEWDEQAGPASS